ncbi:MAG TPA: arabinoxylan arabinofuranohydrolase [Clostridium sp.]|nr:arabinoxylan arabinofuranohydrolase [Clostridium sp.]
MEKIFTSESNLMQKFSDIKISKNYKDIQNTNPCMTQKFTADPAVMEYNGRLYVYSTNDEFMYDSNGKITNNTYSDIVTINCMSSSDMVNWTDHGSIPVAGKNGAAKWAACSWAPAAAHKTINGKEKFFLYFANSGNGVGVLSSDSPLGPWIDPLGHALVSRSVENCANITWLFDPAVYVDDDGTGYLCFGGGVPEGRITDPGTARIAKLGNDMISISETPVTINAPYMFEDSGINKFGEIYYYTYCTNWSERSDINAPGIANIAYMTSKSPFSKYEYQGTFLKNPKDFFGCEGNNHHSLIEFKNKYYIFYHSQWLENEMGSDNKGYRCTHVDEVNIIDGKIMETEGTLKGVEQLVNVNPYEYNKASNMAWEAGVKVTGFGDTGVEMKKGNWIGISKVSFIDGTSSLKIKASSREGAVMKVCLDEPSKDDGFYVIIPKTENIDEYKEITIDVQGVSGVHNLFFVADSNCTFEGWQFSK